MTVDHADATEQAVLTALAGIPPAEAAANAGIEPAELADAIRVYRAAGRAALRQRAAPQDWLQVDIQFPDQHSAECVAVDELAPQLCQAEDRGLLSSWWFIRKPRWRLRCQPGPGIPVVRGRVILGQLLDTLQTNGQVSGWCEGIYEPEVHAFGGIRAMDIAHVLFRRDSRHILDYLAQHDPSAGRRELSILLCNLLMRAAGQDWYERGDIWARVAAHRPNPPAPPPERLKSQLHRLMTADFGLKSEPVRNGSLTFATGWVEAFAQAGRCLADLSRDGQLTRGIRAVLAHHVLFHWNRIGVSAATQATLAAAARDVVLKT